MSNNTAIYKLAINAKNVKNPSPLKKEDAESYPPKPFNKLTRVIFRNAYSKHSYRCTLIRGTKDGKRQISWKQISVDGRASWVMDVLIVCSPLQTICQEIWILVFIF